MMNLRSGLPAFCAILLASSGLISAQAPDAPTTAKNSVAASNVSSPVGGGQRDDKYRIGYRDKLNVQVFRHPELTQTVSVNPNGAIKLFRLREPIVAVCKTEEQLALDIAEAYQKDYLKNPEVTVAATEQMSQAVSVIGAVEKPGPFNLSRKVHLLELLSFAGGPSKEAGSRVLVFRSGSGGDCADSTATDKEDQVGLYGFKIRDLQEGKQSFMMHPGDIVSVLEADIVFVYGNVSEQGQVIMKQPMTLTQAIASAKGLRPATRKDKVRIIRQKPGSLEPEVIVVDLTAIDKQKAEDPFLQPNDIVALSEDRTKSILNNVVKSFTQGIPTLVRPY